MAQQVTLDGKITKGIGWATDNWERMVQAHLPELNGYERGTLNVSLSTPWSPPGDEEYSIGSHRIGVTREQNGLGPEAGTDFLKCGNYIHPRITVLEINGIRVRGKAYYPAGYMDKRPRGRLEILSKEHIRKRLGIGEEELAVTVVLVIEE